MISPINRDVVLGCNHQLKSLVFCPKLVKNLVFKKLVFNFCSSHNSNSFVKNSESPPIRYLVHNHIQVSRLIGYIVFHQRKCLLGVKKSCTVLTKGVLSSDVQKLILRVYQNKDKKNLKRVAWGLDVGHKDQTMIKSLVFTFAFF